MASQVFCLALLAVSAFGHDLKSSQQYVPAQNYYQNQALYNQQPVSYLQGQVPYTYPTNYLVQKQAYYLPYVAQKLNYIPASVRSQYLQHLEVPAVQGGYLQQQGQYPTVQQGVVPSAQQGVEGQVFSPLLNRKVVVNHDKQEKVHLKKDKSTVVQVPINEQARQEEQEYQRQEPVNYRRSVNDNEFQLNQESVYPYQVRDVNQRLNFPVQDGVVRSYPEISRQVPSYVQGYPENYYRYADLVAPRYPSVYQPVSQVYPVGQDVLSQYLRPSKPVIQVTVDTVPAFPAQQVRDQPAYYGNDDILNIDNNLVF